MLKMLQEHQRTSAPKAVRLSIRTAVCTVICRLPAILAPLNGCCAPNSERQAIRPGISASAISISRRPKSAWEMSLTLYCSKVAKGSVHKLQEHFQRVAYWRLEVLSLTKGRLPTICRSLLLLNIEKTESSDCFLEISIRSSAASCKAGDALRALIFLLKSCEPSREAHSCCKICGTAVHLSVAMLLCDELRVAHLPQMYPF